MKKIALIGSTGSIGKQVLSVCKKHPDKFKIVSLSAGENTQLFLSQTQEFKPLVATCSKECEIRGLNAEFYFGEEAFLHAIIKEADVVVVALVGFLGLKAVLKAIELKKDIALANKESLVLGGALVTKLAKNSGVNVYPIDSEHSAIWQALGFDYNTPFSKIIITASGGALRDFELSRLECATPADVLKHPNWKMGKKITVDSATLVNKAFEVIEAKWLFNTDYNNINAIIHRESIIHSLVEFKDGSYLAQLSKPNMELPIMLALSAPTRLDVGLDKLDLVKLSSLTFSEIDNKRYPCFLETINSAKKGKGYSAVCNGANEKAVELFLKEKIKFTDIEKSIKTSLDKFSGGDDESYQGLKDANEFGVNIVSELFKD